MLLIGCYLRAKRNRVTTSQKKLCAYIRHTRHQPGMFQVESLHEWRKIELMKLRVR